MNTKYRFTVVNLLIYINEFFKDKKYLARSKQMTASRLTVFILQNVSSYYSIIKHVWLSVQYSYGC
jgi:hypothetical protein